MHFSCSFEKSPKRIAFPQNFPTPMDTHMDSNIDAHMHIWIKRDEKILKRDENFFKRHEKYFKKGTKHFKKVRKKGTLNFKWYLLKFYVLFLNYSYLLSKKELKKRKVKF